MSEKQSEHEKLARSVATQLAGASTQLAFQFTAKYDPFPVYDLTELVSMKLNVRDTQQRTIGRLTRAEIQVEYDIEITARVQVSHSKSVMLTRMKTFAEQLSDFFWFDRPEDREQTLLRIADKVEIGTDAEYAELSVVTIALLLVFQGSRVRVVVNA